MSAMNDAISAAAAEIEKGLEKPETENKEEVQQEEKVEGGESVEETGDEGNEETEVKSDDLSEDEKVEAAKLYKALKNPNQRQEIVREMVKRVGLDTTAITSKTDVKEARKSVIDIVKEELGPEFKFMSDKLGSAIDKALEAQRQENLQFKASVEAKEVEREVLVETERLATRTKGESRKYEGKMMELADKIQPGPNVTMREYLHHLYIIASSGAVKDQIKQSTNDKINRNANNTSSRIAGKTAGNSINELPNGGKMSLDESVKYALSQMEKGKK